MADTIRALSALQTLLADNTARAISPQDLRDMLVSLHGVYGAISTVGAAVAQGLTTTFAKLTGFTANGTSAGTTPDHSTDQITVLTTGEYRIDVMLQGAAASAGTFTFAPSVNGTESTVYQSQYIAAGTETFTVVILASLTLAANDIVTVEGKASGSINYTLQNAQLRLHRIA